MENLPPNVPHTLDGHPSLSIALPEDDKVLLNAHTGCSINENCDAFGFAKADLYGDPVRDGDFGRQWTLENMTHMGGSGAGADVPP
jgi:hypothetical protein